MYLPDCDDENDDDADDDASVDICQTFPDHSPISAHSFGAKKSHKKAMTGVPSQGL